jgi:L-serine deaminase
MVLCLCLGRLGPRQSVIVRTGRHHPVERFGVAFGMNKVRGVDGYDVIVIGGGAAGLSGALTLARARRSVLLVDAGELRDAPAAGMHGFLTRDGLPPGELVALGRAEVERYGGVVLDGRVAALGGSASEFAVTLEDGRELSARRLLVATGLVDELPDVPGLRELWGGDVVHCPYCHGYEVRDEPIGVLCTAPRAVHLAQMLRQNELAHTGKAELDAGIDGIWHAMRDCIARGLATGGQLPGGLNVKRRAAKLWKQVQEGGSQANELPHDALHQVSLYAMAVNEENAAGGRVVTAPTNGAAGIIPAVLRYYAEDCKPADPVQGVRDFLLVAAGIGMLCKRNASISGAEVGCQGEVGVACAMAAAGLVAALGGSNEQVENAAEIGIEHHLGMTCDPIGGLVQIPCIERNGMGAIKAITAASLALKGDGTHFVSLDQVIETMRQTGADMQDKYKETSLGGLAIHVVTVNHAAC